MLLEPRLMWTCNVNMFSSLYLQIKIRAHYESLKAIDKLCARISWKRRRNEIVNSVNETSKEEVLKLRNCICLEAYEYM
jgi:hypothetical protein